MVYVKIKDIPDGTFFDYDIEKARIKFGAVCSTRDIFFKMGEHDKNNCRVIHFTQRWGVQWKYLWVNKLKCINHGEIISHIQLLKEYSWINIIIA